MLKTGIAWDELPPGIGGGLSPALQTTAANRHGEERGSGLGAYRWVVERTFVWFKGFRRPRLRFERVAFMHEAACTLAPCVICLRAL